MSSDESEYDLFISYSREPDAALALEVERFLESFHLTPPPSENPAPLARLRVCLDGSDFSLEQHSDVLEDTTDIRSDERLVRNYLASSRKLLILCSRGACDSNWVGREVQWFLEYHAARDITVAYTEDREPWEQASDFIPAPLLAAGFDKFGLDLRGYDVTRCGDWGVVADFRRELTKLAAMLLELDSGELYPIWLQAELNRAQQESRNLATTARFETLAGDPAQAAVRSPS